MYSIIKNYHPKFAAKSCFAIFLTLIMALLDTGSVASVLPFLDIVINSSNLSSVSGPTRFMLELLDFEVTGPIKNSAIISIGFICFSIILTTVIYKLFAFWTLNKFIEGNRYYLASALYEKYLRKPYAELDYIGTGNIAKVILSEVDQVTGQVIRPLVLMIANAIILICVVTLLALQNFWLSVVVFVIFGSLYTLALVFTKKTYLIM